MNNYYYPTRNYFYDDGKRETFFKYKKYHEFDDVIQSNITRVGCL